MAEPEQDHRDRLSTQDKIVAGVIALVLVLIILAIFRLGFAMLYG
jgi:hypothetical protein